MYQDDLDQKNALLAAIIESSDDAIIGKDLNSVITSWNRSAERMFGYSAGEVIGKTIYLLIPDHLHHEEEMIIGKLRRGRRIEHYETVRRRKDGTQLHISITVSPIKNAEGVVVGASKIARDITRQKQDTELIRQYTQRLEIINSVSKTISAQLNVGEILQTVTDATTQLSGAGFGAFFYNKTDAQGDSYTLYTLSGAPREAFEKFGMPRNTQLFKVTFEGEGVVRSDDITQDERYGQNAPNFGMPEGHLPVKSYLAVPVKSQAGTVIGGLFFGHSEPAMFREEHEHIVAAIASQAAIALDNAKLYEEIKSLNNKKDEFIAFASHELKTPLTTISGYMQLARRKGELSAAAAEKVERQVNRLNVIISDLLDLSRIQAGKLQMNFQRHGLYALLNDSIEAVDFSKHKLVLEQPPEDMPVTVDGQKLVQVLINLYSNAIKYSEPGTQIRISAMRFADQVRISVSDEGMGISAADLDKIFNQFYRVSTSSGTATGLGLGLFISKEIMEIHLGKIWAESEVGKGSTFHLTFPINRMISQ